MKKNYYIVKARSGCMGVAGTHERVFDCNDKKTTYQVMSIMQEENPYKNIIFWVDWEWDTTPSKEWEKPKKKRVFVHEDTWMLSKSDMVDEMLTISPDYSSRSALMKTWRCWLVLEYLMLKNK